MDFYHPQIPRHVHHTHLRKARRCCSARLDSRPPALNARRAGEESRRNCISAPRLRECSNWNIISAPQKSLANLRHPSHQVCSPRVGAWSGDDGKSLTSYAGGMFAYAWRCTHLYFWVVRRQSATRPSTFRWRPPVGIMSIQGHGLSANGEDFLIGLAFSGGGMRAAAFSYGVLSEFDGPQMRIARPAYLS
jgi:hypothetical protein